LIPTGGFGEPFRWPGELVGLDVDGLAFAVAVAVAVAVGVGVGVGVGVRVGVATTGTGEMAERVAGGGAEDDAAPAPVAELAADELPGA
jgi:hypothetical protein